MGLGYWQSIWTWGGEGVTAFKKGDHVIYQGFLDNDRANFQQYTLISESLAAKVCRTG